MTTPVAETALISIARRLIQIPSENPPGDTTAVAEALTKLLNVPNVEIKRFEPQKGVVNLVAIVRGAQTGPRVVLNGHLDTFAVGDPAGWSTDPFGGEVRDGRLYGRGAGDMKSGIAILVTVVRELAQKQSQMKGELVLTLVSDEETGGIWGTRWLLANVPESRGDYLLNADAGHPRVVRYGEKGVMWLKLTSTGKACHGAHVHLGINAIELLMAALQDLLTLRQLPTRLPDHVLKAMEEAREVSEQEGGVGEFENLRDITMNIGSLHSGHVPNIVPGHAEATVDIRFPSGFSGEEIKRLIAERLSTHPGVQWETIPGSETEPALTSPDNRLVQCFLKHAREKVAPEAVANMRVGLTDARLFRHAGMPAVVYGPTAFNMGGVDEHVLVEQVESVFQVQLAVAKELLSIE
ncbi:ArgE/DapE family deacylase [Ottowia thiooxydans]|uniref:ArgE/DapE family deacylase n=1 Tax=Ottowia thiooxydans TaxID=219182 RepID=UPI000686DB94|nr:ArgE/DapE family deacylase [Ottowia thiooxydans]